MPHALCIVFAAMVVPAHGFARPLPRSARLGSIPASSAGRPRLHRARDRCWHAARGCQIAAHAMSASSGDDQGFAAAAKGVGGETWFGDTPYPELPAPAELAFDSSYTDRLGNQRGFCNWLVPGKVMLGRYPHGTPVGSKTGRPSPEESRAHLRRVLGAGVTTFVMLQEEVPAQDDAGAWPANDLVPLADAERAEKYPEGFSRYYCDAVSVARELGVPKEPVFLHLPIADFGVPDMGELLGELFLLRDDIRKHKDIVYIHCWGGRGRAGTVGACLYLMLRYKDGAAFDVSTATAEALTLVQRGYETRVGEDGGGSQSPETEEQREFVRMFAAELYAQYSLNGSCCGGGM